jgi:peroxiredoxin
MEGWQQKNTAESIKILSDDHLEFNSKFSLRVDDSEINIKMGNELNESSGQKSKMLKPGIKLETN